MVIMLAKWPLFASAVFPAIHVIHIVVSFAEYAW